MKQIAYILIIFSFLSCERKEVNNNLIVGDNYTYIEKSIGQYSGRVLYARLIDLKESYKDFPNTDKNGNAIEIENIKGVDDVIDYKLFASYDDQEDYAFLQNDLFDLTAIFFSNEIAQCYITNLKTVQYNVSEFTRFEVYLEYLKKGE